MVSKNNTNHDPTATELNKNPKIQVTNKIYYNINNIPSQQTYDNCINFLLWNLRSCKDLLRFDHYRDYIAQIKSKIDIKIFCETWIDWEQRHLYSIPGHEVVFTCRQNSLGGGIAIYLRDTLNFEIVSKTDMQTNTKNSFEYIHMKLHGVLKSENSLNLIVYYRPPHSSNEKIFLNHLESTLANLVGEPILIAGDINIDILKNNTLMNKYTDILDIFNCEILNNLVTRQASNSIIDHFIKCEFQNHIDVSTIQSDTKYTDHNIIICSIKSVKESFHNKIIFKKYTNFKLFNEILMSDLSNLDLHENVNILVSSLQKAIIKAHEKATNLKKVKTKHKDSHTPYFTYKIARAYKKSENLRKRIRMCKNSSRSNKLIRKRNKISKALKTLREKTKSNYFNNLFSESSISKNWATLNTILGRNRKKLKVQKLKKGDIVYHTDLDKAQILNSYYINVIKKLNEGLDSLDYRYYGSVNCRSIYLNPVCIEEIKKIILELKNKKSVGDDCVSVKMIKESIDILSPILCTICNKMFESGNYPESLKLAKIVAIYKGNDCTEPSNYRPIALLSNLNKIFEKVIYSRLSSFFEQEKFFYKKQYGFRAGYSTEKAAIELIDQISSNINKNKVCGLLFIDLKKAFDSLRLETILDKASKAGIRGKAFDLIESYLKGRSQYTNVGESRSTSEKVCYGVPQGSLLGPLLFLIAINDFANVEMKCTKYLYADDTVLVYTGFNEIDIYNQLLKDISMLEKYMTGNGLFINVSKTKLMFIGSHNKNFERSPPIYIQNEIVERVSAFKYLGLIIDEELKWSPHIDKLFSNLKVFLKMLWKVSKFIPIQQKLNIYYSFIHSKIQFMLPIWGCASNIHIKKIQVIQNKALKCVFGLPLLHESADLYINSKILPVLGLYQFKIINNIREHMKDSTKLNINLNYLEHNHQTRNAGDIRRPVIVKNAALCGLSLKGPYIYNRIPLLIKNIENEYQFKKALKNWLLDPLNLSFFLSPVARSVNFSV